MKELLSGLLSSFSPVIVDFHYACLVRETKKASIK
jgi:hypothetical protein